MRRPKGASTRPRAPSSLVGDRIWRVGGHDGRRSQDKKMKRRTPCRYAPSHYISNSSTALLPQKFLQNYSYTAKTRRTTVSPPQFPVPHPDGSTAHETAEC